MADKSLGRKELVAAIAEETGSSQVSVSAVIDGLFSVISSNVADSAKVTIPGWVAFERTHRAAREGRNPATGETIKIPAGNSVKATAGSKLKAAVK